MGRPRLQWHGSRSMYCSGCRCDDCREANRVDAVARRRARGMRSQAEVSEQAAMAVVCGTVNAYTRGCRCDWCRRASAADHRARVHARNPSWRRMPQKARKAAPSGRADG